MSNDEKKVKRGRRRKPPISPSGEKRKSRKMRVLIKEEIEKWEIPKKEIDAAFFDRDILFNHDLRLSANKERKAKLLFEW